MKSSPLISAALYACLTLDAYVTQALNCSSVSLLVWRSLSQASIHRVDCYRHAAKGSQNSFVKCKSLCNRL